MVTRAVKEGIGSTLFGKARRLILALLYTHSDEQFYLRRIAREAGLGIGPVQRELVQLAAAGILTKQHKDGLVYYQANSQCPVFAELRGIIVKTVGLADVIRESLKPISDRITVAFIFGSFAAGDEKGASDVDLVVIGRAEFGEVSDCLASAEKKLQREVNSVVYPVREARQRLKNKDHFISSLMGAAKIFVAGSEDDFRRLAE